MFIRVVDDGLERFLRDRLPLSDEAGDISFDTPQHSWAEAVSRTTLNLFLFDVNRSPHPNRAPVRRVDANGMGERRPPQPMVEMNYMISAWAGSARDEHQLLGSALSLLASTDILPPDYLDQTLSSSVQIAFVEDERLRARDIWSGARGTLKAAFSLQVTVAADSFGWAPEATKIAAVEGSASRMPSHG